MLRIRRLRFPVGRSADDVNSDVETVWECHRGKEIRVEPCLFQVIIITTCDIAAVIGEELRRALNFPSSAWDCACCTSLSEVK
jgi:hypothetical protein